MAIKAERFGETPDGQQIDRYTLTNENGVSASFSNLGGTWLSMMVPDKNGEMADVVLGYDTVEHYRLNPPHLGAIIGRNANRIGGAAFTLEGTRYELAANDGPNNLHSGPDLYRSRVWEVELDESSLGSRVSFSLFSPDGDQGYPGNAEITVSYTLTPDNAVCIEYHMVSDADTIANFTNHSYFNLAGHGSGSIAEQQVWIDADTFTPADAYSIPTGEILPVKGTPMDFTVKKPIGRDIGQDYDQLVMGHGYDHNWVLNHKPGEVGLCAKAFDDASGRMMEVYTDLPGMQFYTANFLTNELPGKDGAEYGPRCAYCFETQYYPDAVNKPQFPSPVLKAGEEYRTTTIYKFMRE
ncbi:MAG: aldose epimerase family protein [Lachnospiraceae bacterium]|nr:aldose epimerase family protein [Lachnospiraceae bacterium]